MSCLSSLRTRARADASLSRVNYPPNLGAGLLNLFEHSVESRFLVVQREFLHHLGNVVLQVATHGDVVIAQLGKEAVEGALGNIE